MNRVQIAVLGVTVLAFGGAYMLFNSGPASVPQIVQMSAKTDTDDVMIAKAEIAMGTQISEADYAWQPWPKAAISELMIRKSEGEKAIEDVKGSVTRASFLRGEPMRRDKLIKGPNSGYLSAVLPSGMRAVAINIDQAGGTTAGGFVLPNDRVDVIRVFRDDDESKAKGREVTSVQTILTNVQVLAIGQNVEEQNGKKVVVGANATLELDPDQAEMIIHAEKLAGGNLYLTLRSLLDDGGKTASVGDLENGKAGGLTIVRFGAPQQATR
jgi:pilus assembly protein CpaB